MADTIINVRSGFYDAVDGDRTYSADDMNKPYKKVVSDGVFATPQGTPSSELQVVAGNGMSVNVSKGNGICAGKWFENNAIVSFVVPENSALTSRIDSVIMQVDTRNTGRVGNLVYRTGTAASDPEPPAINTISTVQEYRLANITVAAGATSITDSVITDTRGSAECPWISALIIQPDTSTLWRNFYDAFAQALSVYEADQLASQQSMQQAWDDFFGSLTQELSMSMNLATLKSTYTAEQETAIIPINIAGYDDETDILLVFVNGLLLSPSMYTTYGTSGITLAHSIAAGNKVDFLVLKSVVAGNISSAMSLIEDLQTTLTKFMSDSGWIDVELENGATAPFELLKMQARNVGGRVYLRGAISTPPANNTAFATLPVSCRPDLMHTFTSAVVLSGVASPIVVCTISTQGVMTIAARSGEIPSGGYFFVNSCYLSADAPTAVFSNLQNGDYTGY